MIYLACQIMIVSMNYPKDKADLSIIGNQLTESSHSSHTTNVMPEYCLSLSIICK